MGVMVIEFVLFYILPFCFMFLYKINEIVECSQSNEMGHTLRKVYVSIFMIITPFINLVAALMYVTINHRL